MRTLTRRTTATLAGACLSLVTAAAVVAASPGPHGDWHHGEGHGNDWPHGGSQNNTWPYAGGKDKVLVAVGDIGCEPNTAENASTPQSLRCDESATGNLQAEYKTVDLAASMKPDLVALLGDEQYEVGKYTDFQNSFDKTWGALKSLERPAPGNHEFYGYTKHGDNEAAQNGAGYFSYFNGVDGTGAIRSQGQAGDHTTTKQGWYSYDLGDWHVISLNVECASEAFHNDCSTTGSGLLAQETTWLADDLKRNDGACTIAYWHQPTFSATTSKADAADPSAPTVGGTEGTAADAWWKLLYSANADLVLAGHEHVYARFQPMDPAGHVDTKRGIRQFIIGTGGEDLDSIAYESNGAPSNPNVVTGEDNAYGVMKLTLGDGKYAWNFQTAAAGPGADATALTYSDGGKASCHRKGHHKHRSIDPAARRQRA